MIKTVLIPIDFKVASLNTLKLALEYYKDIHLQVVLIYPQNLDDSITELLFYNPEESIKSLTTAEFSEGIEVIKNRFEERLVHLMIKLFHCHSKNQVNAFLEAYRVDEIYVPTQYKFKNTSKIFNPIPILKKSNKPMIEIDWNTDYKHSELEQLIALFN